MMNAVNVEAQLRSQGIPEADIARAMANSGLVYTGLGGALQPAVALEAWIGSPAQPVLQGGAAALPAVAAGIAAVIRWLVTQFGAKQILVALLSFLGIQLFKEVVDESGQGRLEMGLATIIPGQQEWLGEWPVGLGQIEGRLVRKWTAGGAKVYFAEFEQPRKQGSHIQFYVYSVKKGAWLPYSYRKSIVFGARELDIAAALGGRKRIGKKKALRALAGKYGGTRSK